jgi:hypothetical protein
LIFVIHFFQFLHRSPDKRVHRNPKRCHKI